MASVETKRVDGIAYREAMPASDEGRDPLLCVHGFPESSYMWREVLAAVADGGRRALAPDLIGFGGTPPDPPGTWERQLAHVERFRQALGLERVTLVVHDWGGLIGMRWACEHPGAVSALVISDSGFFPDFKWHGMAEIMRTPGEGEKLIEGFEREGFAEMMGALSPGFDEAAIEEYWKPFETDEGRAGVLELYRSGDREKLAPYDGQLAKLGVPTLLLWGENDPFAPLAGAHRFEQEIPGAELVVVEGSGHFVYDDAPERCAREIASFLSSAR